MITVTNNSDKQINAALLSIDADIKQLKTDTDSTVSSLKSSIDTSKAGVNSGTKYDISISGNAATATTAVYASTAGSTSTASTAGTASKVTNSLTITNNGTTYTYNGSSAVSVPIATSIASALTTNITNTYSNSAVGTTTYNGSADVANNIYLPNQSLNSTDSPTFNTVTAALNGNATSADKVNNVLTLNVGGTTTSYDGSTAMTATIYTPDQEVNKTSSPTFNSVTAALNGNATSADKVNNVLTLNVGGTTTSYDGSTAKTVTIGSNAKLTVATTDTYTAASTTEYDGSTAKTSTIYTPDQEVNKTSSPTFANPTVTTINGLGFTPKWSAPFIPYVRTDGVTEIGKYVDFHGDAEDSNDYDARIEVTHNSTCKGNGEMTINAANITAAKFSMTHINLYGDSLTFTSPLSDANVSQCWAKAYGNILRIHVAMPIATQTIANSTIVFNLSGAMPTMAYSPTRLVLICDSISLGRRYTADIDLDQSGVARIYFAGVAGSVADISGIYGDCMLTLN